VAKPAVPSTNDPLRALSTRIAELDAQLQAALEGGDVDAAQADGLLASLREAEAERARLLSHRLAEARRKQTHSSAPPPAPLPVRERVLWALDLLGVPSAVKTVAEVAGVRTNLEVDARQLASLRRSEQASFDAKPDGRAAYVVPALHHRRLDPMRGLLTSSSWSLRDRIVGPLSPRADHLRATRRLAEHLGWAREHAPATVPRLEGLVWGLARSIPGSLDSGMDVATLVRSAQAELSLIEEKDLAERQEAAERALRMDRRQQLFGAGLRLANEGDGS
jgi:hypothetical protein